MQGFFTKTAFGLDISARSVALGAVTWKQGTFSLLGSHLEPLTPGVVAEGFGAPGIADRESLAAAVRSSLQAVDLPHTRRTGVSLPDSLFRVQMIDLDKLPENGRDREQLIRWRLEKAAVFDTAGTVLRYQVSAREDRGYSILACVIKQEVLVQYESLLDELGLEAWRVAPASFHVLNLYAPVIAERDIDAYALVWMVENAYSALIVERGTVRLYRNRDIKAAPPDEAVGRLVRELDDTMHFYMHMDRGQRTEIGNVFLAGMHPAIDGIADGLRNAAPYDIEVLVPTAALPGLNGAEVELAPALGAGGSL